MKAIIKKTIDDIPFETQECSERHAFLADRLFNGPTADHDTDHLEEKAEDVDLEIHPNEVSFDVPVESTTSAKHGTKLVV